MRDRLKRRERGMTTIGLIILVSFVGLFVYAGIRLTPVYLEYFNVLKAVEGLKSDVDSGPKAMRVTLEKRFSIEDISSVDYRDIEITKEGSSYLLHIAYDAQVPFVGNVGFVVHFDHLVTLTSSTGP
jgi:Domain of unknown function (DUF4845)